MDKYHGVYVKIALANNDTVKGHIHGKDSQGNLILQDCTIEHGNGYTSKQDMLPIITTNIKDLEVLDMNKASNVNSTNHTSDTATASQSTNNNQQSQQQHQQQHQKQHQQQQQQQQQQLHQQQQQQHQYQLLQQQQQMHLQHQFHQQQHTMHLLHNQQQEMSPLMPQNTGIHMDPAVLFQQQHSPALHRDPAIISSQANISSYGPKISNQVTNTTSPAASISSIDPAVLFTTPLHNNMSPQAHQQQPNIVQQMFQNQSQPQAQIQHQQEQKEQLQQPGFKALDPSMLFKQQNDEQSQNNNDAQNKASFQDPAIVSVTNTSEVSFKPKKPLFGAKKGNKPVKEVVVFEDYSDFEKGKTGNVKKTSVKKSDQGSNASSHASTPNTIHKKHQQPKAAKATTSTATIHTKEKPLLNKMKVLSVDENKDTPVKTKTRQPVEIVSKSQAQQSKPATTGNSSSGIPASLIPPRVRASTNSTPKIQQKSAIKPVTEAAPRILTVSGGIQIPTVNANQMETAKVIGRETGLTQSQLVENGAFGISMMVLKAIGGHRRIQPDNHNAAPVVVILAGPTAIGESGIAAARHLANRGCQVIIGLTEDSYCGATVEQYKALAKFSGARIVYSIDELPDQYTTPVDMIVDALLGSDMLKITSAIKQQMNWANNNKAPVLSIEFPSGVNPNDGSLNDKNSYIHPKWTLCLGAPYTGCTSRAITGELFLADSGLPFLCFEQSVRNFHIPWGSEFVLALEYA